MYEVLGEVIALERKSYDAKLTNLEARVVSLEAELAKQRGVSDGEIIDLPSPIIRKRRDAA